MSAIILHSIAVVKLSCPSEFESNSDVDSITYGRQIIAITLIHKLDSLWYFQRDLALP